MKTTGEMVQMLEGYLTNARGLRECAEWLAGVDWDDPRLTQEEKEALGLFELLVTEVSEGLRGVEEFWQAASEFVAERSQSVFTWQLFPKVLFAVGTADTTTLPFEVVYVDQESRSWSISPQVVPSL